MSERSREVCSIPTPFISNAPVSADGRVSETDGVAHGGGLDFLPIMKSAPVAAAAVCVAAVFVMGTFPTAAMAQIPFATNAVDMSPGQGAAEAVGTLDLQRLSGPITLDGVSDEAAWTDITPLALTMYGGHLRRGEVLPR